MPAQPVNEDVPSLLTVAQVHAEFEKLLKERNHMGVRNLLGDAFLDPRNPFQRVRRRPKRSVVLICFVLFLAAVLAYGFHVR